MRPFTVLALMGLYLVARGVQLAYGGTSSGSGDEMAPGIGLVLGGTFLTWVSVKMGG